MKILVEIDVTNRNGAYAAQLLRDLAELIDTGTGFEPSPLNVKHAILDDAEDMVGSWRVACSDA